MAEKTGRAVNKNLSFFKPNKFNKGAACTISFSSKDGAAYFGLVRQVSWNEETKKGTFSGGASLNMKFNATELSEIIDIIERNVPQAKALYHTFGDTYTYIGFNPHKKEDVQLGFALSVTQGKEGGTEKDKWYFGFTFAEAALLREYLKFILGHFFSAMYSEAKKQALARKPEDEKPVAKEPEAPAKEEPKEEEEDEIPF
jgi:hypothetical protein